MQSSSSRHKKTKSSNGSNLSKEPSENYSASISDELINRTSSHISELSDISTTNMNEWDEKNRIAIQNIRVKDSSSYFNSSRNNSNSSRNNSISSKNISISSKNISISSKNNSISSKNNSISNAEQSSLSALSDVSSVFMENTNEKSLSSENQFIQNRGVKKVKSKREFSTSEGGNDSFQSETSSSGWKEKNREAIANTPIFNKKRFYGDGETSEELQSSEKFSEIDGEINEEDIITQELSSSNNSQNIKERDAPILGVDDLSSASSIDTGEVRPFADEILTSDQSNKKRKKKKVKKVKKNKNTNSSASYVYESASETLSNLSDSKNADLLNTTPRGIFSRLDDDESNGSKIYFNSDASDAPAVKRVKKKIDNLISPHRIDSSINNKGIRVQYTDEEIISPRRRQKVAQIFIEGDSEIEYSAQSESTVYGRLSDEKYPHNITDSELSDISLVDFDTPKVKYLKSPTKEALYNDSDFTFKKDQMKIANSSFSSSCSLPIQSRDIDFGKSIKSDDEVSNDEYEQAQRKIQKFAIEDDEAQEDGALFDIKIPDQDEQGKLLLDLKKNAIMLSSSSSQESDVEDEDKLEMLGDLIVTRGLPFLKLSDSENEGDPLNENIIEEEEEETENAEILNTIHNDEDSEPPIQYDVLLAPKSLTTPRSPRTPRTPNEPVYTGKLILTITVIEAINLPRTMPKIRREPYVLFKLKGSKEYKKTNTCHYTKINSGSNLNSMSKLNMNSDVYSFDNQKLVFVIDPSQNNVLTIKVRDEDKFGGDVDISSYDFVLSNLKIGESDGWFRLTPVKNVKKGGKLHVQFNLEREEKPEPPHTPRSPKNIKTNSSQNSEHSQNSHRSKKSQSSNLSQNSFGKDINTETESNNDVNFSSISDLNSKENESIHSLSESGNDNQIEAKFSSLSDPLDSQMDQHLSSPSGSEYHTNA